MGLASTSAEQTRLAQVNPDNYRQYPTGCAFACHFAPQNSACTNSGTQAYPTNNYCMGYAISRVSQSGYKGLLTNTATNGTYPAGKKLPDAMVPGLPNSLYANLAAGFILRHRRHRRLHPIARRRGRLRREPVVHHRERLQEGYRPVPDWPLPVHSVPLRLFSADQRHQRISHQSVGTINYAAANLATLLDTNINTNLGSGGTHIDRALNSVNNTIPARHRHSRRRQHADHPAALRLPRHRRRTRQPGERRSQRLLVRQQPRHRAKRPRQPYPNACKTLKDRGIIVSVLYIPYQKIDPVNTSFANNEGTYANNNIPFIAPSLQACASSPASSTPRTRPLISRLR